MLNLIPLGASVSVPDYLGSFTSLREYNSLFPANFRSADFVVVDLLTPQFISSMDNLDIGVLVPRFLKELLEDENYTLVYSSGGLVAFARGSDEPRRTFSIEETTLTAIPRIVFKKGVNLEGFEIPEKMTAEEKVKISFDWSVSSDLKKKVFFVSTWKNNGRIYQEIHLPSFALLPVDQWEEGKVYHEEFGVVLPDKLPAGNYEFVLSVIDFDYRENVESHYLQMVEIK